MIFKLLRFHCFKHCDRIQRINLWPGNKTENMAGLGGLWYMMVMAWNKIFKIQEWVDFIYHDLLYQYAYAHAQALYMRQYKLFILTLCFMVWYGIVMYTCHWIHQLTDFGIIFLIVMPRTLLHTCQRYCMNPVHWYDETGEHDSHELLCSWQTIV